MLDKQTKKQRGQGKGRNGNLIPCKPGETRNPHGRPPKGYALTDIAREFLECKADDEGKTRKELLISRIYQAAMKGDMIAARMIWNYVDGQPMQRIEQKNIEPIEEIRVVITDGKQEQT